MKKINFRQTLLAAFLLAPMTLLQAEQQQISRPDIVIADFEQGYGDWTVEGEAFNHPTTRQLPPERQAFAGMVPYQTRAGFDNIPLDFLPISQPPVGHSGKGLADSWDPSYGFSLAGILTSPKFTIERRFIRFQIGGFRGSLELFVDGKKEFQLEALGERTLRPWAIDLSSFQGREAQLVIRDSSPKQYIAVDEIVADDSAPKGTRIVVHKSQCVALDKQMDLQGMHYLVVPINNTAPRVLYSLEVDGKMVLNLGMRLAIDLPVDFWASYPLDEAWKGERLRLTSNRQPVIPKEQGEDFMRQITLAAKARDTKESYAEPGRPQLVFTPKNAYNYDPDGLFFYQGLWHLFYLNNPVGLERSNELWGHATSPDLFHWTEQLPAIRNSLTWVPFSGGGLVDHNNDSGLKQGSDAPILLFYSQNGNSGTALTYSVDGGKTFKQYEKNPLFLTRDPSGHDPKVVWYPKEKKWVMAICDVLNGIRGYEFYESKNLLDWKYLSTDRERWSESSNLFPLPLDGDQSKIHWILHSCNRHYQIGDFNGKEFIPLTQNPQKMVSFHGDFLAGQVFDNAPDGRCILMGALSQGLGYDWNFWKDNPDLPVATGMNLPLEVTLRTSATGPRLYLNPVKEIGTLVSKKQDFKNLSLKELSAKLSAIKPELFDIEFEWDAARQGDFKLKVWDRELFSFNARESIYEVQGRNQISIHSKWRVSPVKGTIKVRLICDRSICSYFINDGYEAGNRYLAGFRPECKQALSLSGDAGQAFKSFRVNMLRPTWSTIK